MKEPYAFIRPINPLHILEKWINFVNKNNIDLFDHLITQLS